MRTWWCQSGFMAIDSCLSASTALQDHVPATFWKNSCHLLVTSHLLILHITYDFNIYVDVHKFITFLDLCDLKQLVDKPTHLHGHILDLILSPSDQDTIADVKICVFVSDHALVKCTVAFPCQVAHTPNIVQYRRYHRINMSDFRSDLKNTSFVS